LPVYVSVILIAKAAQAILAAMKPITAVVPASVQFREVVAARVIIIVCFIAGLIVRTGPGLRAKNAFEGAVLERLPGYTLLRGLAGRFTGRGDEPTFAPALIEIEEALVPALIIEKLEAGSFTVVVPSVPTPMAGALYILPPERVHHGRCAVHIGAQGVLEMGRRCRRVCAGNAANRLADSKTAAQLRRKMMEAKMFSRRAAGRPACKRATGTNPTRTKPIVNMPKTRRDT
jgi:uncharacterized membrane protein